MPSFKKKSKYTRSLGYFFYPYTIPDISIIIIPIPDFESLYHSFDEHRFV